MELIELKKELEEVNKQISEFKTSLKIEEKEQRVAEIENMMLDADFWNDSETASSLVTESKSIKKELDEFSAMIDYLNHSEEMIEFLSDEDVRYGTFRFLYNTIDECKQNFIRSVAKIKNVWILISGKIIDLPKKITDDATNMANFFTNENNTFVSTKDIFALANKIETPNYAVEEFKKFLLMR